MTSRELMDAALVKTKTTQAGLARQMGWTPQNFNLRLNRNSIRADEFLAIMDALGVDVTFTMRESGEILKPHVRGHGRRLCGNCDKITFDTAAAEAISNSFYEDGVNEFNADGEATELYVDSEGPVFHGGVSHGHVQGQTADSPVQRGRRVRGEVWNSDRKRADKRLRTRRNHPLGYDREGDFLYPNAPYARYALYGHAHDRYGRLHPFTPPTPQSGIAHVRAVYEHIPKRI